jgi:hypothetical protein
VTVEEIIDQGLAYGDNVPESDASYIPRRRRALSFMREVENEIWWAGDHHWKREDADLIVPAGAAQVAVPSNYDDLGPYGDLYRVVGGVQQLPPLTEEPESRIQEARTGNRPTDLPRIFSIFGQDPDTFLDLIQIPVNPSELTLRLTYMRKPPKLLDAGDPDQISFTPSSITRSGTTATVTSPTAHGLVTFDSVVVSGANETEYNGTFEVVVTGPTTFTYEVSGSPATPATGTITVAEDVTTANASLNQIPERFHVTVVLNGLKAKLRESKADGRWRKYEADFQKGISSLKLQVSRFRSEHRRSPSFFGER